MTPGKSPSSTASSSCSTLTSLHWRRADFNQTLASENKTTGTSFFWQGKLTMTLGPAASAVCVGRLNENRKRLLELCFYHNLCVTNTFFSTTPSCRVSWHHPRSRHWHQLDPSSLVSSVPVVITALTAVSAVYRA